MAQITDLPVELLLQIFGYWGNSVKELRALSCCNRFLHWLAFDSLFRNAFQQRCKKGKPSQVFMRLVFHAIKCDSQHIARWLCYHELSKELNGCVRSIHYDSWSPLTYSLSFIPSISRPIRTITYLHLAIIGDAPKVANHLVKYGTDVWEGGGDYPDITPLYLAIANPRGARNLDAALRIACSYALPKTCRYLLTRGADPNSLSRFGLAAIHLAVRSRLPWRNFEILAHLVHGREAHSLGWETCLIQTVTVLLRFGANPNLGSDTPREHPCGHKCWLSPDCEHRGQAVLHYACSGAPKEVVSLLLQHGADPNTADDDGYLPLFSALCQDHNQVAMQLLQNDIDPTNLVVVQPYQSTALHIACRFACVEVVSFLLERGADANAIDVFGQTPLHEVLGQSCLGLQDRVLEILPHLDNYGALAEVRPQGGLTARQMARAHPFASVRQFFDPVVIDHRGSEHFQEVHDYTWSDPPTVSPGRFQRANHHERVLPEALGIYSCDTFPFLSSLPPAQDGVKQAPTPDSVWLDKKTTDRLRVAPPPTARHQQRNKRGSGYRKGATASVGGGDDNSGEKPSPAVRSEGESRVLESATFWSTLASSRQNPNHQKVEAARDERKENKRDGGARRRQRGNKWAPLDFS